MQEKPRFLPIATNLALCISLLLILLAWVHSHRFAVHGNTNFEYCRLSGSYESGTFTLFLSEANYGKTTIEARELDQSEDLLAWNTIAGTFYGAFGGDPLSLILLIPFHLIFVIVLILLWFANFRRIAYFTEQTEQNASGKG